MILLSYRNEETTLKNDYLKLIDNANPQTIEELRKEVLINEK